MKWNVFLVPFHPSPLVSFFFHSSSKHESDMWRRAFPFHSTVLCEATHLIWLGTEQKALWYKQKSGRNQCQDPHVCARNAGDTTTTMMEFLEQWAMCTTKSFESPFASLFALFSATSNMGILLALSHWLDCRRRCNKRGINNSKDRCERTVHSLLCMALLFASPVVLCKSAKWDEWKEKRSKKYLPNFLHRWNDARDVDRKF